MKATAEQLQALAEFLTTLGSHGIYDSNKLAETFKKETGLTPCWRSHTYSQTKSEIQTRGLGGELTTEPTQCAYGWEVAEDLAAEYADFQGSKFMGRGFRFRAAVEAVEKQSCHLQESQSN